MSEKLVERIKKDHDDPADLNLQPSNMHFRTEMCQHHLAFWSYIIYDLANHACSMLILPCFKVCNILDQLQIITTTAHQESINSSVLTHEWSVLHGLHKMNGLLYIHWLIHSIFSIKTVVQATWWLCFLYLLLRQPKYSWYVPKARKTFTTSQLINTCILWYTINYGSIA